MLKKMMMLIFYSKHVDYMVGVCKILTMLMMMVFHSNQHNPMADRFQYDDNDIDASQYPRKCHGKKTVNDDIDII